MRSIRLMAIPLLVCLATTGLYAQKQVVLTATIADPSGGDVASLSAADVEFKEGGAAGTVTKVEALGTVIPKIQILLDNGSGVPAASLSDYRTAVKNLINELPMNVETTLVTTAPQPRILEKPTTDRIKLLSAVDRLTPDNGVGKFVDSLNEATDRAAKDKQEGSTYTIISVATSSNDSNFRESDLPQIQQRVQQKRMTVHVVVVNSLNSVVGGSGGIQVDLGQGLAGMTGGRFETIASPNRLLTLLPEIGKQVTATAKPGGKLFRITAQRPANATGKLGPVSLGVTGKVLSSLALESTK